MYKIRVFYEDTDAAGFVYYANYLKYIERARTQLLIDNRLTHTYIKNKFNILLVVKSCNLNYIKPASLDDNLYISSTIVKKSRVQIYLNQDIFLKDNLIVEAQIRVASINLIGEVAKMPNELYNIF